MGGETQQDREWQNQIVLWPSVGLSSQQGGLPRSGILLEQNPPVLASAGLLHPWLLPQPRAGGMGIHGTARAMQSSCTELGTSAMLSCSPA